MSDCCTHWFVSAGSAGRHEKSLEGGVLNALRHVHSVNVTVCDMI